MTIRILALTLLHFLWQGALVAALLATLHALLPRPRAGARYVAACAALALMLALPLATAARLAATASGPSAARAPVAAANTPAPPAAASGGSPFAEADTLSRIAPALVLLWLSGVCLLSIRTAGGWLAAARLAKRDTRPAPSELEERLRRIASRLSFRGRVRLLESLRVAVPCAIGIVRPVVLVPAGIATGMSGPQLDALLAHELAHVRRRDFLVNALQIAAETVLFYHPAVWWVSHRIRVERENACDDLAVAATGDAAEYARLLLALEERRSVARAPRLAMAADGHRGDLWNRIVRLLPSAAPTSARSGLRPAAGVVLLTGVLATATGATLFAPEPEPAPVPSPRPAAELRPAAPSATPAAPAPSGRSAPRPPKAGRGNLLSPDQLVAFRIHDVTPEFIDAIEALGYSRISADDLIALRVHDVSPAAIREMQAFFGKISLEDCVGFQIHGVTPAFVREVRGLGLPGLSADQAVAFRIHGVTPGFVREVRALGYETIDADALVAFRVHGVTPQYIRSMNRAKDEKDRLSADDLIEGRIFGETAETNENEEEKP